MEPLLIGESCRHRSALTDVAVDLVSVAAGFRRSLPDGVRAALADLVRAMNCYYSNLIEGHDTHSVEIERALRNDYSNDPRKRDLQLEAKAHIAVQQWIDAGGLRGRAVTGNAICETHCRFGELLPDDLLWVADQDTGERVRLVPGELRRRDVRVGGHIAISTGAIPRFLAHFERIYSRLGKTDAILAATAAHHRLLWIHPFLDGNGRVARLMSHAVLLETLDTGGVWSVARGLARNVAAYKGHLAACDLPLRNDLDGRGSLSEEELANFTRFFLETCIDQVSFMEELVQPGHLRARILLWAEEEARLGTLQPKAGSILEAVLYRGELPRGEVAGVVGATARHARRLTAELIARGVLASETDRALFLVGLAGAFRRSELIGIDVEHLRFDAAAVVVWLPRSKDRPGGAGGRGGRRDQRLDVRPFGVGQIAGIAQTVAVVAMAVIWHLAARCRTESQPIEPVQAARAAGG